VAVEEAHPIREARGRLGDDPRLADTGLSADRDDRAASTCQRLERSAHRLELVFAADERHLDPCAGRSTNPTTGMRPPSPLSFQLDVAQGFELRISSTWCAVAGPTIRSPSGCRRARP
jgi:hypothetical protein